MIMTKKSKRSLIVVAPLPLLLLIYLRTPLNPPSQTRTLPPLPLLPFIFATYHQRMLCRPSREPRLKTVGISSETLPVKLKLTNSTTRVSRILVQLVETLQRHFNMFLMKMEWGPYQEWYISFLSTGEQSDKYKDYSSRFITLITIIIYTLIRYGENEGERRDRKSMVLV